MTAPGPALQCFSAGCSCRVRYPVPLREAARFGVYHLHGGWGGQSWTRGSHWAQERALLPAWGVWEPRGWGAQAGLWLRAPDLDLAPWEGAGAVAHGDGSAVLLQDPSWDSRWLPTTANTSPLACV